MVSMGSNAADLPFAKGHGLGNDYLVVDQADISFELNAKIIQALCDRHRGIGSDGILIGTIADEIALRIYNPDGSEAEKSGNGLRIFGAYLYGRGVVMVEPGILEIYRTVRDQGRPELYDYHI